MRMKKNNAGFSLIELIVAMAILMIASTAIFELVIVSSRHYQKETLETDLQYEAQLSVNQVQDMLIDATRGVSYRANGSQMILTDADIASGTVASKEIIIYNADEYFIITWDASLKQLLYSSWKWNDSSGAFQQTADRVLMAEYVADFSADFSQTGENGLVYLRFEFDNKRQYEVCQNVTLRNRVAVNATAAEVYGS